MSRQQHLTWCKNKAKLSARNGADVQTVWPEFLANMKEHAETKNHPRLTLVGQMVSRGLISSSAVLVQAIDEFA